MFSNLTIEQIEFICTGGTLVCAMIFCVAMIWLLSTKKRLLPGIFLFLSYVIGNVFLGIMEFRLMGIKGIVLLIGWNMILSFIPLFPYAMIVANNKPQSS